MLYIQVQLLEETFEIFWKLEAVKWSRLNQVKYEFDENVKNAMRLDQFGKNLRVVESGMALDRSAAF